MTLSRGPVLLALVGLACAFVAWRAGDPTWVAPVRDEVAPTPVALSGDVPAGYEARRLDVEGMCCRGCGTKLHQALVSIDGVREAAVDSVLGVAWAVVPADFETARLEAALSFDKYTAVARPSSL